MPSFSTPVSASRVRLTPASNAPTANSFTETSGNGLQGLAFKALLAIVFFRFTTLPEVLAYQFGVNLYLLYLLVPICWLGMIASGGLQRAFSNRNILYLTAFFGWMVVATPFSVWPGGSAQLLLTYAKTEFPQALFIAGLVTTWKELRQIIWVIAISPVVTLLAGRMLTSDDYRMSLNFSGSIANSNDYAAHLLLVLPIAAFLLLRPAGNKALRLLSGAVILFGLQEILRTASRGAVVSLIVLAVFLFFKLRPMAKVGLVMSVPVVFIAALSFLPHATVVRLSTLFTVGGAQNTVEENAQADAAESATARSQLFQQSVKFTLQHPIFGVGPGQFSNASGGIKTATGGHGAYNETHNTYSQVSSETGFPGLFLFLGVLWGTFKLMRYSTRICKNDPRLAELELAASCVMLGMIAYYTSVIFLSQAYRFYTPSLVGLAIAMARVATREAGRLKPHTSGLTPAYVNLAMSPVRQVSVPRPRTPRKGGGLWTGTRTTDQPYLSSTPSAAPRKP